MYRWDGGGGEIPKGGRAGRARSLGIWLRGGDITGRGAKSLGHRESSKSTLVTILETESRHINQPGSRIFLCIFLCLFSNLTERFKSATKLLSVNQLSLEVKMFLMYLAARILLNFFIYVY